MTEPLTVDELERRAREFAKLKVLPQYQEHITMLLVEFAESHSRQLWLEAAERVDDYGFAAVSISGECQNAFAKCAIELRAKAEQGKQPK